MTGSASPRKKRRNLLSERKARVHRIAEGLRFMGPQENTPRGYLPAKDDHDTDRDAVGEANADPVKRKVTDAMKTKGD